MIIIDLKKGVPLTDEEHDKYVDRIRKATKDIYKFDKTKKLILEDSGM